MTKQSLQALRCPCCHRVALHERLVQALNQLDRDFRSRFQIMSGYRCLAQNAAVHGHTISLHLFGLAVDLAPLDVTMPELVRAVLSIPQFAAGGFGWYPDRGIIHADVRTTPASWCKTNDRYGDLQVEWHNRYRLKPLPKVPATRPDHWLEDSAQPLPYSPDAPSAPPTLPPTDADSPNGTM